MEPSNFDDQIFSDFAGPLSPLGPKPLQPQSGHSIQVMLGMTSVQPPSSATELCPQRLPEVHSLLPGSPKLDHYKTLDYGSAQKVDYSTKLGCYSPSPKYDYVTLKLDQYSPGGGHKIDYGKAPLDYGPNPNGKIDYSPTSTKMDYDHMQMFSPQPPTQVQPVVSQTTGQPPPSVQPPSSNGQSPHHHPMDSASAMNGIGKKGKGDDVSATVSTTSTGSIASASDSSTGNNNTKKNDKKKGDPNGVKKKKTR